ncbi:unnamed protein product, partial [Polarella glacialis]
VLMSMCAGQEMALVHAVFGGWRTTYVKDRAEKDLNLKFQAEVEAANLTFVEYKKSQLSNLRNVLNRKAEGDSEALMHE